MKAKVNNRKSFFWSAVTATAQPAFLCASNRNNTQIQERPTLEPTHRARPPASGDLTLRAPVSTAGVFTLGELPTRTNQGPPASTAQELLVKYLPGTEWAEAGCK